MKVSELIESLQTMPQDATVSLSINYDDDMKTISTKEDDHISIIRYNGKNGDEVNICNENPNEG